MYTYKNYLKATIHLCENSIECKKEEQEAIVRQQGSDWSKCFIMNIEETAKDEKLGNNFKEDLDEEQTKVWHWQCSKFIQMSVDSKIKSII